MTLEKVTSKTYWSPPGGAPTLELTDASLQDIWQMRYSGRLAEAQDAWLAWCSRHRLNASASFRAQYQSLKNFGLTPEDALDALLLDVSFLRHRLETSKAERRLADIRDLALEENITGVFSLHFQSALNRYQKSEYTEALDGFFRARRFARTPGEYHIAFFNALLCLENLGYDFSRYMAEFSASYASLDASWKRLIAPQYNALLARQHYSRGDLSALVATAETAGPSGQLSYFVLWFDALPSVTLPITSGTREAMTANLLGDGYTYHQSYRTRTLKFLLANDDLTATPRHSDISERFYLWTWFWMTQPTAAGLSKLAQLRATLPLRGNALMTSDDHLMIENALRWLALFSGTPLSRVAGTLENTRHPTGPVALPLSLEKLTLDWLFARRDGNEAMAADALVMLREHPLFGESRLMFGPLTRVLTGGKETMPDLWKTFAEHVNDLTQREPRSFADGLVVDHLNREVRVLQSASVRESLRSAGACRVLRLLAPTGSAEAADVLWACFGLKSYDPVVHAPKLGNLCARLNRTLAPHFSLQRRDGRIYATLRPTATFTRGGNLITTVMLDSPSFDSFFADTQEVSDLDVEDALVADESSPQAPASAMGEWVCRKEIEQVLSVSRASAVRQINAWIAAKLIERRGEGKASRYRMMPALRNQLLRRVTEGQDS
jgi:hypothetical protein